MCTERAHSRDGVYFVSQHGKNSDVCIHIYESADSVVGSSLTTHCPLFVSKYARLYTVRSIKRKLDIDKSRMEILTGIFQQCFRCIRSVNYVDELCQN